MIEGKKIFMQNDLISIIIPIYNKEEYLERCVKSVIEQTYSNIEIILVDDGSKDKSSQMCDYYGEIDNRVVVVHKENGGLSDARNKGIDASKGRFLFFLDADDYIAKEAMEVLHKRITEENADIAICNFTWINTKGESLCREDVIYDEVLDKKGLFEKLSLEPNFYYVIACNKLYNREIFEKCRFKLGKTHEDEFIIHHVFGNCRKAVSVSKILYYYIQSENSITTSAISIKNLDYIEAIYDRIQFYRNNNCKEYISKSIDLFWWGCSEIYTGIVGNNEKGEAMLRIKRYHAEMLPTIIRKYVKDRKKNWVKNVVCNILFWINPKLYKVLRQGFDK